MEKAFQSVILSILLLFNSTSFAQCPEEVQVIEKDQKANCTGFLFSPEAEKKASKAFDEAKTYKEINVLLERRKEATDKENDILTKRLSLYIDTTNKLVEQRQNDKWEYAFNIVLTSLAIYGAAQLAKEF